MAPLRNNRASNRSARTQIDHDIMEGLPVRQWRKTTAVVNTTLNRENSTVANVRSSGWKELPMPRGYELYSHMSQALLRAARMGQANRPPPPQLEDEKEPGEDEDPEGEMDSGFVAVKWSQVPKEMEVPEQEFLAKRRKGLPSVYGGVTGPLGISNQMRKTKVRKIDAEGNTYVWDVLAPEGTMVEGEILEGEEVMTEAPAPGTVVEGVGIANAEGVVIAVDQVMPTPPRRRPPPPKRKPKGPGRGRKKKPSTTDGVSNINGVISVNSDGPVSTLAGIERSSTGTRTRGDGASGDIEMGDDSILQDGDEGGEDGSEDDDDEGEDGEDGDREEGELSPSPDTDAPGSLSVSPSKPPLRIIQSADALPIPNIDPLSKKEPINRDVSSSPDLPLAATQITNAPSIIIEPAGEAALVPASSLAETGSLDISTVEEPETLPSSIAELPPSHNPFEGLTEPQQTIVDQQQRCLDGEQDLLGSLERHLDGKV